MERWALIAGDDADLVAMRSLFENGDPKIAERNGESYVWSAWFDALPDTRAAHAEALRTIQLMNGVHAATTSKAWPVAFGGHIERRSADGTRVDQTVMVGPVEVRVSIPSMGSEFDGPAWINLCEHNPYLAKALRLLGRADVSWSDLYKVWESARADLGKKRARSLAGGKKVVTRFTMTACHQDASGDDARHAWLETEPPQEPMTFEEACKFARSLLQAWVRERQP